MTHEDIELICQTARWLGFWFAVVTSFASSKNMERDAFVMGYYSNVYFRINDWKKRFFISTNQLYLAAADVGGVWFCGHLFGHE